jgi:hypothetical protein
MIILYRRRAILSTSYHAYYPYNAYIDDTTSEWISGSGYDSTLGTYTGSYSTIVDEVIISGEWTGNDAVSIKDNVCEFY